MEWVVELVLGACALIAITSIGMAGLLGVLVLTVRGLTELRCKEWGEGQEGPAGAPEGEEKGE